MRTVSFENRGVDTLTKTDGRSLATGAGVLTERREVVRKLLAPLMNSDGAQLHQNNSRHAAGRPRDFARQGDSFGRHNRNSAGQSKVVDIRSVGE